MAEADSSWSSVHELRLVDEIERQLGQKDWRPPRAIDWRRIHQLGSWPSGGPGELKYRYALMRKRLGVPGPRSPVDGRVIFIVFEDLRQAIRKFWDAGKSKRRKLPPKEAPGPPPSIDVDPCAKWLSFLERVGPDAVLLLDGIEFHPTLLARSLRGLAPFEDSCLSSLASLLLAPVLASESLIAATVSKEQVPSDRWVCVAAARDWTASWDPLNAENMSAEHEIASRALLLRLGRDPSTLIRVVPSMADPSGCLSSLAACLALARNPFGSTPPPLPAKDSLLRSLALTLRDRAGNKPSVAFICRPLYKQWAAAASDTENLLSPTPFGRHVRRDSPALFAESMTQAFHTRVCIEPAFAPRSVAFSWTPSPSVDSFVLICRDEDGVTFAPTVAVLSTGTAFSVKINWAAPAMARSATINGRPCDSKGDSPISTEWPALLRFSVDRLHVSVRIGDTRPTDAARPSTASETDAEPRPAVICRTIQTPARLPPLAYLFCLSSSPLAKSDLGSDGYPMEM